MIKEIRSYNRIEQYDEETTAILADNYKSIIANLGEDVNREGLQKTPERAAKAMQYLTHGYGLDPLQILKSALFTEDHKQMIVVKDIEVYSMCEHHMLPFFGKAHVAYIPNGKIVGLSKIPRIVDAFARRMQVHMCMCMRGIQKQNSVTTTSSFNGAFEKNKTRKEFISLVSNKLS
jgi:GTP cyclohydrolase IA